MSAGNTFLVDFIAKGKAADEWRMVLVEDGPWKAPLEDELRRVQERLYECIDAAIDGQLAEKFPESFGKRIVIQLDGYQLANDEIREFFDRFAAGALVGDDYHQALSASPYVADISFELNLDDGLDATIRA